MTQQRTSLKEDLRALPRGGGVLVFGTFLNTVGTFVVPFLAIYMTGLGDSAAEAGWVIAAYGVGTMCACILGGHLADCLGRRKTIVLSMFAAAITMLCLSQSRSVWTMMALSGLAGLSCELYRQASTDFLVDLV